MKRVQQEIKASKSPEEKATSSVPCASPCTPSLPSIQLPWLMLPSKPDDAARTFYFLSDGRCCTLHLPVLLGKRCYAVSHGWLLLGDDSSKERLLVNPITNARKELPQWEFHESMQHVAMSSSPADPGCVVSSVLVNHVAFCRPGDARWSVQRSTGSDPDYASNTDYVCYNGKFYFLRSKRKLLVVDLVGGGGCKQVDMNCRQLPPADRFRNNFLVELSGELLMVTASDEWMSCKVFRADISGKEWVAVESLGDHVLFLGRGCSVSVPAAVVGVHCDRIYFSFPPFLLGEERQQLAGRGRRWFWAVFVMGVGCGALKYAPPIKTEGFCWEACHWFVPNS